MSYYRLLEKDYAQIQQNEPTESCLRKEFARATSAQHETDDKIIALLIQWKKDKQSASGSHFSRMTIDPLVTQKADKIRLAMKITAAVGILLAVAALTTACAAGGIYLAACLGYLLAVLLSRGVPFAGSPPIFVAPSIVPTLLITSGACAGGGILAYIVWCILDRSNAIREDRIQKDKNFQEFINNYLEKKLEFFPSHEDLKDHALHSIYFQWKDRMQKLSADVTRLHSKMQLRSALEDSQLEAAT